MTRLSVRPSRTDRPGYTIRVRQVRETGRDLWVALLCVAGGIGAVVVLEVLRVLFTA